MDISYSMLRNTQHCSLMALQFGAGKSTYPDNLPGIGYLLTFFAMPRRSGRFSGNDMAGCYQRKSIFVHIHACFCRNIKSDFLLIEPPEQFTVSKPTIHGDWGNSCITCYGDAGFVNGESILDSAERGIDLAGPSSGRSQSFEGFVAADRPLDIADFTVIVVRLKLEKGWPH